MKAARLRFCWRSVACVVSIRSTKRLPCSLWVPKLVFRQMTPGRIALGIAGANQSYGQRGPPETGRTVVDERLRIETVR